MTVKTLVAVDSLGIGGVALHTHIQRSELVIIESAGHFPYIERPEAFFQAVGGSGLGNRSTFLEHADRLGRHTSRVGRWRALHR